MPPVSEEFSADASRYIAAMDLMINKTKELVDQVQALQGLITALNGKTIDIDVGGNALEQIGIIEDRLNALNNREITVLVNYKNVGGPDAGRVQPIIQPVVDQVTGSTGGGPEAGQTAGQISSVTAAMDALNNAMSRDNTTLALLRSTMLAAVVAMRQARLATGELADTSAVAAASQELLDRAMNGAGVSAAQQRSVLNAVNVAERELNLQKAAGVAASREEAAAQQSLSGALANTSNAMAVLSDRAQFLRGAIAQNEAYTRLLSDAYDVLRLRVAPNIALMGLFSERLAAAGGDAEAFRRAVAEGNPMLLSFAQAAQRAGDNVGGILIPLSAASFGITGLGAAIHLVVMGVFEFLAVFLPAMYAAAAAAAVMAQGVQLVQTHLSGVYTAAEALGPMLHTTAGNMLGLGNSLQTAQNMANPGVYELLGAALRGIQSATGPTTNGLSAFGQMGLDVTHILDAFSAKIDVDIVQNMDKIHSVLAAAVTDLVQFGQIFGNVGHALLNFAAAMPGAAQIALAFVDALSQLLKWVSSLPAPLITVVMVFEELYRWSGLIAGAFGLLGRAIGLIGTLGIPVLIKIGSNVAAMGAAISMGIAVAITNFGALVSKITGGEGAIAIDGALAKIARGFAGFAAFLGGPWGAALGLGVLGLTALTIWLVRSSNAEEAWVVASQKAVSQASNLQVLNVIAQQMAVSTQRLTAANAALATSQNALQNSGKQADPLVALAHANEAVTSAIRDQNAATQNQQTLMGQTGRVLGGASAIANQFGTSFTTALALADLAGVKLSTTTVQFGKNINAAGIQIENLVNGYAKMDQTGGILANTMNAVNIQAGLQASKVSQVNGALDQFISMSTGLTGSYTQFNLDLQQIGNQAQTTGAKIQAFTGNTQLSVSQIAQALTSFSGTSAQIWQSYNQSISQANTFMDNLRIAAASGTVSQTQFGQAAASVVQQMVPYASSSKAALAELMAISSEANGPAYDSTKSLTQNYQALKDWTDKNALSSGGFRKELDTLTAGISNVSNVAKQFAGTLQTDVINAIAAASVDTGTVTAAVQKYTQSLAQNGSQNKQTRQDQAALTAILKTYGFSAQDISQIEQQLTNQYGQNANAIVAGQSARKTLQDDISKLIATTPAAGQDIINLASAVRNHGTTASQLHGARQQLYNDLVAAGVGAHQAQVDVDNLTTALKNVPKNVSANVTVSGSGGEFITSSVGPGGRVTVYPVRAAAEGGVLPGYEPGRDSIHALLSPGEGILIPQAVRALGGVNGINAINKQAQHFAWGGVTGLPSQLENMAGDSFGAANASVLASVLAKINSQVSAKLAAMFTSSPLKGVSANLVQYFTKAMALTGVPSSWLFPLEEIALHESGLNPNAINLSDSNAAAGDPSRGLMQTIMSTFMAYHQAGTSGNIYDPTANIAAAINYIKARYGSVLNVPGVVSLGRGGGYVGYDSGGYLMPGLTLAYNGTGQPERVSPPGDASVIHNVINMDGKTIYEATLPYAYQKSARNNGNARAGNYWTPGSH